MTIKESLESIKDLTVDMYYAGKILVAEAIAKSHDKNNVSRDDNNV